MCKSKPGRCLICLQAKLRLNSVILIWMDFYIVSGKRRKQKRRKNTSPTSCLLCHILIPFSGLLICAWGGGKELTHKRGNECNLKYSITYRSKYTCCTTAAYCAVYVQLVLSPVSCSPVLVWCAGAQSDRRRLIHPGDKACHWLFVPCDRRYCA